MAKIKSYSCPTCGSFLEVNRDQDVFDCPFCGSHFDAVSFHGQELYEQARTLLVNKNYSLAREKYEYLLKHKPDDFELLYGYACAVGEVPSLVDLILPGEYSVTLESMFNNDPRYKQEPSAPYFAKISELFEMSRKFDEKKRRLEYLQEEAAKANTGLKEPPPFKLPKSALAFLLCLFWFITWATLMSVLISKVDTYIYFELLMMTLWFDLPVVFAIILGIRKAILSAKEKKARKEEAAKEEAAGPVVIPKTEEELLAEEIYDLNEEYWREYERLPELRRRAGGEFTAPAMNVEPEKKVVPSIISKNSFLIKDEPVVDTEEAKEILKTAQCAKCGAELALDKDRKLFVCNHCGVTYNYSLFIGDPLTKANNELKNSEFKLADKLYAGILKKTPSDFVANRGRVLCACKFRGFTEAKLNTAFKDVDWEAVDNALDFAIQNSNVMTEEYFTELKELLGTARTYFEKCEKIKDLKKEAFIRPELSVYSEQKDELYDTYYDIMSYFSVRDRKLIVAVNNPERVSSDVLYLRTGMLKIGSWNSISSIVPGDEHNDKLNDAFMFAMEAVKQTEFPYKEYFELCRQYFLFVRDHSQDDEVFKQRQIELVNADKRLFPGKNKN